jgi:hypothetical protein
MFVAPIQGLAMKKELCFACSRRTRPLAWAFLFQAFGLTSSLKSQACV